MLSSKAPSELITVTFDFSALTTSVSTSTVVPSVSSGNADATPAAILSGTAQTSGAKVLQQIQNGVNGTIYELLCTATAADGSRYQLADLLPVVAI